MSSRLEQIIDSYDASAALDHAATIPSSWYTNQELYDLELKTVFTHSWHFAARRDQLAEPGRFVTADIACEPIVVVRGNDQIIRGFYNVCRHHAAAVMTELEGQAAQLRCPYHGWTYSLAGELKGTPDFAGVCSFEKEANGLVPLALSEWENWIFVKLETNGLSLPEFLGADLVAQMEPLKLDGLHWQERRHQL